LAPRYFADHRNATTPIGLDDRGIAEIDLDPERRLDVWKVRSVQLTAWPSLTPNCVSSNHKA
jgi:hypothetical protein